MDKQKAIALAELAAIIASETDTSPNFAVRFAVKLIGYSNRLQRYHETGCNYGLNDKQKASVERLRERARADVKEIGLTINHFNSDPRGYAIYLTLPSGRYNSFGGAESGWGI